VTLFNVRMRAAQGGAHEEGGIHISGGERLVDRAELTDAVSALVDRALRHEAGDADFINVTIDRIEQHQVVSIEALPIRTEYATDAEEGRLAARRLLESSGVDASVAAFGVTLLANGAAPGGRVMRGAAIVGALEAMRLEPDRARGVRVAGIDWERQTLDTWRALMTADGLARPRVWEALALASKVVAQPDVVAELCWSDDPSYVTGYVASQLLGYVRIPHLKQRGDALGGRIFFVRQGVDIADLIHRLEVQPAWIDRLP